MLFTSGSSLIRLYVRIDRQYSMHISYAHIVRIELAELVD